jgi:hypothetical protein
MSVTIINPGNKIEKQKYLIFSLKMTHSVQSFIYIESSLEEGVDYQVMLFLDDNDDVFWNNYRFSCPDYSSINNDDGNGQSTSLFSKQAFNVRISCIIQSCFTLTVF